MKTENNLLLKQWLEEISMKKIFILITILAIGILSCRNKQNENTEVGVSQNNT